MTRRFEGTGGGLDARKDFRNVFDDEQQAWADAIVAKYPNPRSAVLPLLFLVQGVEGHVTEDGMRTVADMIGLTPAQILASGSFYTMLKKQPQGEYLISVCRNISCTHRGAYDVIVALSERLGVDAGGSTADGRFTFETVECLATCDGAPSMQINYDDFYNVTPRGAIELVDKLERGEEVKSARGERIRTSREVSFETATAGARLPGTVRDHGARTVGGEAQPSDFLPASRPKLGPHEESHRG